MKNSFIAFIFMLCCLPLLVVAESFTVDEMRIMQRVKVKVQLPGDNAPHVVSLKTDPRKLLNAHWLDLSNVSLYRLPSWLKRFVNLRRLDLSGNQLGMSDMVATLKRMPKLDELHLSDNPLFEKNPIASLEELWQALPQLAELDLNNTHGTASNYGSMAALKNLSTLNLSGNRLGNDVAQLQLDKLPILQELNLASNGISQSPLSALPTQQLGSLDLSSNKLTKFAYVELPKLQVWNLSGNGTIRLADEYADLLSLPQIKKLQYDTGSDYDNLSKLPKGLKKKLRQVACSSGSLKIGSYIDHCNGTVTDTKTGLMWKQCSEGQNGLGCTQGTAKKYQWDDAVKQFKDVRFASYKGWRLPTREELRSLVYCSNGTPQKEAWKHFCSEKGDKRGAYQKPTINLQAFPNTPKSWYWSSSPYADNANVAWVVYFNLGYGGANYKKGLGHVRLVRSGQ